jgi:hypothetical protein
VDAVYKSGENSGVLPGARGRAIRRVALGVVALGVFLTFLEFPIPAVGHDLDTGWALALGHFMKARRQAGVDYVFTYGPLGFLSVPCFFPGLFWLKYWWAIAFASACSFVSVRLMTHLSPWLWLPWLWVVVAFVPFWDSRYMVPLVASVLLLAIEGTWRPARIAPTVLFVAVLGLTKFSALLLGTGSLAVAALGAPKIERRRALLWTMGLLASFIVVLWLAAGQSPWNFPRFVVNSLEVARGYSDAMPIDGSPARLSTALQILVLFPVAAMLGRPEALVSARRIAGLAIIMAGLFVSWKEGFVRQDPAHESVFFCYALVAVFFLCALDRGRASEADLLRGSFLVVIALEAIGAFRNANDGESHAWWTPEQARARMSDALSVLLHPRPQIAISRDVWRTQQRAWELPAVRSRVGRDTIDMTSYDQATLFWNGLNWHPRPCFQGYFAYTPALALLNRNFYRGADAPRYVLSLWTTIDDRFPPEDDGGFLFELLRRYHPVVSEREYILLERRPEKEVPIPDGETVIERSVAFGETVPLPFDATDLATLSVIVPPTRMAAIRRLVFKSPKVAIVIRLRGSDLAKRYVLVPGLAASEFVINPLVEANVDLYAVYGGIGRIVDSIRLVTNDEGREYYGKTVDVVVRKYPGILPHG